MQPAVSVSPSSGPAGTAFAVAWTGFTSDCKLQSRLRRPDGSEFPPLAIRTERDGTARHTIDSRGFRAGPHELWGIDEATGRSTARVTFNVLKEGFPGAVDVGVYGELTVNRLVDSGKIWGVLAAEAVIRDGEVRGAGGWWTAPFDRESPTDMAKRHILNQVREFDIYDLETLQLVGRFRVEKVGVCGLERMNDCDPDSAPDPHVNFIRGFGSVEWIRQVDLSKWTTYTRYQDGQYLPDRQVGRFYAASRNVCDSIRRMEAGWLFWVADWVKRVCKV